MQLRTPIRPQPHHEAPPLTLPSTLLLLLLPTTDWLLAPLLSIVVIIILPPRRRIRRIPIHELPIDLTRQRTDHHGRRILLPNRIRQPALPLPILKPKERQRARIDSQVPRTGRQHHPIRGLDRGLVVRISSRAVRRCGVVHVDGVEERAVVDGDGVVCARLDADGGAEADFDGGDARWEVEGVHACLGVGIDGRGSTVDPQARGVEFRPAGDAEGEVEGPVGEDVVGEAGAERVVRFRSDVHVDAVFGARPHERRDEQRVRDPVAPAADEGGGQEFRVSLAEIYGAAGVVRLCAEDLAVRSDVPEGCFR